jgi:hypothetical protein
MAMPLLGYTAQRHWYAHPFFRSDRIRGLTTTLLVFPAVPPLIALWFPRAGLCPRASSRFVLGLRTSPIQSPLGGEILRVVRCCNVFVTGRWWWDVCYARFGKDGEERELPRCAVAVNDLHWLTLAIYTGVDCVGGFDHSVA